MEVLPPGPHLLHTFKVSECLCVAIEPWLSACQLCHSHTHTNTQMPFMNQRIAFAEKYLNRKKVEMSKPWPHLKDKFMIEDGMLEANR